MMADIAVEIESLRDFLIDPLLYSRIWMQNLPAKYTPGELSIRYINDDTTSETNYHYRINREYQIIYFGASELDCIRKVSALQRKLNSVLAIKLKGSERHISLGSLSVSSPFKTEDGTVYASIGILPAVIREMRSQGEDPGKIGGVIVELTPNTPKPPTTDDVEIEVTTPDGPFTIVTNCNSKGGI